MKNFLLIADTLIMIIDILLFFVLIYIYINKGISVEMAIAFILDIAVIIYGIKDIINKRKEK